MLSVIVSDVGVAKLTLTFLGMLFIIFLLGEWDAMDVNAIFL